MPTLKDIEIHAHRFSDDRAVMAGIVNDLKSNMNKLKRAYLRRIQAAVNTVAASECVLRSAIESAPELFEKPRTQVLSGVRVGFRKGSGGVEWDDDAQVVALIKKVFPAREAELLIKTTEKPIAAAMTDLDVSTLKKIGVRVENTGDVVVIKPTDSDVDKVVTALLKEATETTTA
jgi:hypothetical protein